MNTAAPRGSRSPIRDLPRHQERGKTGLDRARWHRPPVAVIITHFDYADHLEEAILSVVDQSYDNIECVVVDDGSSPHHRSLAERITKKYHRHRISYLPLPKNLGQIPAFYAGLDATKGEFVCLLDPDDRYAESYIESSVQAHLNNTVFAPLTSTDQYRLQNNQLITATSAHWALYPRTRRPAGLGIEVDCGPAQFFDSRHIGWYWTSTSSLMFRRTVLNLLRPTKQLSYRVSADAYLANGAHMLGGTIFVIKPLVYRQIHERNAFAPAEIFSMYENYSRPGGKHNDEICRRDVAAAFLKNGARDLFKARFLSKLLYKNFDRASLALLRQESPHAAELAPAGFHEWRRRRDLPLREMVSAVRGAFERRGSKSA